MLIMESLKLFGHDIYMSAKPTVKNLEVFLNFTKKKDIKTIVPLLPIQDIYRMYGFDLIEVYEDFDLAVIHYPIKDFSTPANLKMFDYFISDIGDSLQFSNILIHCSAGLGRTGLVTAALLIKYRQYSSTQAIITVRKSRWGAIETPEQEFFLRTYDYYLNGDQ